MQPYLKSMASLKWTEESLDDLARIDFVIAQRVVAKAQWLEKHFSHVVPEKLRRDLKGFYKLRVGDYRAVYAIHDDLIIIHAVGHRRDIYS